MLNKYNSFKVFVANAIIDSIKENVKNTYRELFTDGLIDEYKAKWNRTTAPKDIDKLSAELVGRIYLEVEKKSNKETLQNNLVEELANHCVQPDTITQPYNQTLSSSVTNNEFTTEDFLSSLRELIQKFAKNYDFKSIYVKPDIPTDKLTNAILSYAPTLSLDEVLLLHDDGNNGRCGSLITQKAEIFSKFKFLFWQSHFHEKLSEHKLYNKDGISQINDHFFISPQLPMQIIDIINSIPQYTPRDEKCTTQNKLDDIEVIRAYFDKEHKCFLAPNIQNEKINNAIESYAPSLKAEDVLILADDTLWGSARDGFIISKDGMIFGKKFMETPLRPIKIDNTVSITVSCGDIFINDVKLLVGTRLKQEHLNRIKNIFTR